jgi:hypothetical protein
MKLTELFEALTGTKAASLDDKTFRGFSLGRPRLTLVHLRNLRLIRGAKEKEREQHLELVAQMYGNRKPENCKAEDENPKPELGNAALDAIKTKAKKKRSLSRNAIRSIKQES